MAHDSNGINPRMLDRRVSERYVKRGELAEKDLEKHLKALPDLADEAVPFESKFEARDHDDLDDEDDDDENDMA
jgi:hypothetical protein